MKPSLEHHQSIPYSKSEPDLVAEERKLFYKKYEDRSDLKWKPRTAAFTFSGRIESVPLSRAQLPPKKVQSVPHIPSLRVAEFSPRREREKRRTRIGRCSFGPDDDIPEHEQSPISQKLERRLELPPPEYLSNNDLPLESTLGVISERAPETSDHSDDAEEEAQAHKLDKSTPSQRSQGSKEGSSDYSSFVVFSGVQNVRPGMKPATDGDHPDRLKLCNGSDCFATSDNPCPFTHLSPTVPPAGSPSFSYSSKTPSPGLVGLLYQIDDYQQKRQRNVYSYDDNNGFIFNKHEQSLSPEPPPVVSISGSKRHPLQSIHSVSSPSLTSLARAGIEFPPKQFQISKDDEILGRSRVLSAAAPVFVPSRYDDRIAGPSYTLSNKNRCLSTPHIPSLRLPRPDRRVDTSSFAKSSPSPPSSSSAKYSTAFNKPYPPSRPSLLRLSSLSDLSINEQHPSLPSPGRTLSHQAFPTAVFTPVHGMPSGPVPPIGGAPDPAPALPLPYKPPDSGLGSVQEMSMQILSALHPPASSSSIDVPPAASFMPLDVPVASFVPPSGSNRFDDSPQSSPLSLPIAAHSPPTALSLTSYNPDSAISTESPRSDHGGGESRRNPLPKRKKEKRPVNNINNNHATPISTNPNSHDKMEVSASPTTSIFPDLSANISSKRALLDCFQ